ncbi:MAG: hypothetical protein HYW05_04675 [Candidatus Diapherotrites archaeon]|nr:hypothetical protein [Candidatus Diapherotrites archaeon]
MDEEELKARILHKLTRHRLWKGKHTAFENLQKGLPSHLGNEAKKIANWLIKENFILCKPTNYGLQVSLNPGRKKEIIEIIEKYFAEEF